MSRELHPRLGEKVLLLPDGWSRGQTFSWSVWKIYCWLKDLPFSVQVFVPMKHSFPAFASMVRDADIIIYAGPRDLATGSGWQRYLNWLFAEKVKSNRGHDFYLGDTSARLQQDFGEPASQAAVRELGKFSLAGTYTSVQLDGGSDKHDVPVFVYRRSRER
jgi:hypothetical protein